MIKNSVTWPPTWNPNPAPPVPIAEGDRDNDLVRVIDDIPELLTPLYLLTHRDLQRTPRIRAFLDFVETEIKAFRATLSGKA